MGFHKDTKNLVRQIIENEYANATTVDMKQHKHAYYNTLHEGYGVLLEELWEARDNFWRVTRHKKHLLAAIIYDNKKEIIEDMRERIQFSVEAMAELAQVAAVCEKMIGTINDCLGGNDDVLD